MIRINLLPPEIIERRRWERFYPYVFVVAGVLLAIVLVTWGALRFAVASRQDELQSIEQNATDLRAQAESLAVFELKEQELAQRQSIAEDALSGRVDMGRLAEEVSLVLPEEVWAQTLACDQNTGLSASLWAPEPLGQSVSEGYKSAASTLVRLGSLSSLTDVWLGQAAVSDFTSFQGLAIEAPTVQALSFDVSAKIRPSNSTFSVDE